MSKDGLHRKEITLGLNMPLILKYCQAHGMGLFGPRIIWIFAQFIDLVNLRNFDDCSVQDRKEFSKGMLTMGMFVHDLENFQLSFGMTGVNTMK